MTEKPSNEVTERAAPCPWCGESPDTTKDENFRLTDGLKYGALQCCVIGPEVRTDYKDVSHWKASAIAAWNDRRAPTAAIPRTSAEAVRGTVGELRATLAPFDDSMPINAAFFVDFDGKRACRVKSLTVSKERVLDGRWIKTGDESVPYSLIAWANQDERATPAPADSAAERDAACTWKLDDEDNGIWESSCGEAWSFVDGGPKENGVRFCQGCGKSVSLHTNTGEKA